MYDRNISPKEFLFRTSGYFPVIHFPVISRAATGQAPGVLRCLDLDEEAPLPAALATGGKAYRDFQS